ncbi:MAG: cellulose biosynthesis cyclic di-GMP-binding regulatory protein BcsB, partial [Chloroflexi bacterium]|nr:cellulose biosynthesis cyclic di-GMP-binding regulatory protein BcsB [Chloroflexota bacterium]
MIPRIFHLPIILSLSMVAASIAPFAGAPLTASAHTRLQARPVQAAAPQSAVWAAQVGPAPSVPLHSVVAGTPATATYTLAQMASVTEIVLRGVSPSYFLFVPNPEEWKLTGLTLHLKVTHSSVLTADSTLTVEVNDTPVASLKLTAENVGPTTWDVTVPPELLVGEALAVKFNGYLRVSDNVCADVENVANWARIDAASTADYAFERLDYQPELARFPYPFVRNRSLATDNAVLVVPQDATGPELVPALYLAGVLNQRATWRGLKLYTLAPSELTDASRSDYDLILVGRSDRLDLIRQVGSAWPLQVGADGSFVDAAGQPVAPDTGVVMLITSPWSPGHALMAVTGKTDTAVLNAARAVRQTEFANLARGKYALIPSAPDSGAPGKELTDWSATTFQSLGYSDETVNGLGKHSVHYVLDMPNSRVPESLQVTVLFSHSPFVTTDRSYFVISANGIPQAGTYLTKDNEKQATWEVTIPGSQLVPGRNAIDLLFDLHLPDYEACDDLYLDRAWGVIHSGTSLSAKFSGAAPRPDLANFPVPFDSGAMIVMPGQPTPNERASAFQLYSELGKQLGVRTQGLEVITADQASPDKLTDRNIIMLGLPARIPLMLEALKSAPVHFDGGTRSLQTSSLKLAVADGESVGVIEELQSPWGKSATVMVITGTDDQGVGRAALLLVDPAMSSRLKGDVAIVDARGLLTSLDSRGPAPVTVLPST